MFYIDVDDEIKLKLLGKEDAPEFFNLIQENREYLERYMPRISENKSISDTEKVIDLFVNQLLINNGFRTGICYKDKLVGIVGLKYIDWINEKTEIMCWVGKNYSGKGIGTRSQKKVIEITFDHYKLNKLIGKPSITNTASIKMFEKSGFLNEGVCCQEEKLNDGFTDVYMYYISKKHYEENLK